jgi:hypothetical protein
LPRIRAHVDWLAEYSLSGVWRLLQRLDLKLRSPRVQHYSPDPHYADKVAYLELCLHESGRYPNEVVTVFLDEMGFKRWPEPGCDWRDSTPVADRQRSKEGQWRIIGALNAVSGQVNYLDAYIVGRVKVIEMYQHLVEVYGHARQIYVVQDNWNIHSHDDVLGALQAWPQVEPVWLPTYAPWLNPIEKLWRWLRQDVLKMHRYAADWKAVRGLVRTFLDHFAHGSERLLEYVGLRGSGKLAQMINPP